MRGITSDASRQIAIVQKGDVLRPGQSDHHPEAVSGRFVEKLNGRRSVDANRIDARRRHQREVLRDAFRRRELHPVPIGREGAVRHTSDQMSLTPDSQKLPTHAHGHQDVVSRPVELCGG